MNMLIICGLISGFLMVGKRVLCKLLSVRFEETKKQQEFVFDKQCRTGFNQKRKEELDKILSYQVQGSNQTIQNRWMKLWTE